MAETIKAMWLEDNNQKKIAPKTLSSQILNEDGTSFKDDIQDQLDSKASTSHGTHVSYSTTEPVMDGKASAGSAPTVARSDHKHPTDTSRASLSSLNYHVERVDNPHHVTLTQLGAIGTEEKGEANGVASLDSNGKLQLLQNTPAQKLTDTLVVHYNYGTVDSSIVSAYQCGSFLAVQSKILFTPTVVSGGLHSLRFTGLPSAIFGAKEPVSYNIRTVYGHIINGDTTYSSDEDTARLTSVDVLNDGSVEFSFLPINMVVDGHYAYNINFLLFLF